MAGASRDSIVAFLDRTLRTAGIKDSSCNGLQVQGAPRVRRVGLAVDASIEAYQAAIKAGCQMLVVHHGLIWNGLKSLTGRVYKHVRLLIESELNLYASHLPLDMHPTYGNNIALARMMRLRGVAPFGLYAGTLIGYKGTLPRAVSPRGLADALSAKLGGKALIMQYGPAAVRTVAVVSGGAGDMIEQAASAGVDCYVTGEGQHVSLQLARETNSNVVMLGHYHSEKLGVMSLGRLLERRFGVQTAFLELTALDARGGR